MSSEALSALGIVPDVEMAPAISSTASKFSQVEVDDPYSVLKGLQRQLEFFQIQEEYIKVKIWIAVLIIKFDSFFSFNNKG